MVDYAQLQLSIVWQSWAKILLFFILEIGIVAQLICFEKHLIHAKVFCCENLLE